jgi:cytochrome c
MADGAALYAAKGCAACHGADGKSPTAPMYPKLAGQSATYAFNQMKDIKSGARSNGMSMVMKPMVANVSEAEMQEIANWLATQ